MPQIAIRAGGHQFVLRLDYDDRAKVPAQGAYRPKMEGKSTPSEDQPDDEERMSAGYRCGGKPSRHLARQKNTREHANHDS